MNWHRSEAPFPFTALPVAVDFERPSPALVAAAAHLLDPYGWNRDSGASTDPTTLLAEGNA